MFIKFDKMQEKPYSFYFTLFPIYFIVSAHLGAGIALFYLKFVSIR
jgi:hypothetical protein